jgi:primosomal protein N' (replication factor Y)
VARAPAGIPIVLGSATPSLESWHHAQTGRYRKLELRERAVRDAVLPRVKLLDMERDKPKDGLTSHLIAALRAHGARRTVAAVPEPARLCAGDLLRRLRLDQQLHPLHRLHGAAPPEHRLRCHHCSLELRIPRLPDLRQRRPAAAGARHPARRGRLAALFPEARVLRIDADSTRRKGSAQAAFDTVHRGEVDILIGTQMVAKGHDFKNLTLVGILNPDTALFSQDYRASERLFAQLMQVAGRAGRAGRRQRQRSADPVALLPASAVRRGDAHDYDRFAGSLLEEREQAALPPYMYQALLRAEAPELATAIAFLEQARDACEQSTASPSTIRFR